MSFGGVVDVWSFQHHKELPSQGGPVLSDKYKNFSQRCLLFNEMFTVTFI